MPHQSQYYKYNDNIIDSQHAQQHKAALVYIDEQR